MELPFVRLSVDNLVNEKEVDLTSEQILERKLKTIRQSTILAKKRLRQNTRCVQKSQENVIEAVIENDNLSASEEQDNEDELIRQRLARMARNQQSNQSVGFWEDSLNSDSSNTNHTSPEVEIEDPDNVYYELQPTAERIKKKMNFPKVVDLYSEIRKIESEKLEKKLKWLERKKVSDQYRQKARENVLRKKLAISAKNKKDILEEKRIYAEMDEISLKENHIPQLIVDESVPSVSTSQKNTIQSRISEYKQNNTDFFCGCQENHRVGCWNNGAKVKTKILGNQIIYL